MLIHSQVVFLYIYIYMPLFSFLDDSKVLQGLWVWLCVRVDPILTLSDYLYPNGPNFFVCAESALGSRPVSLGLNSNRSRVQKHKTNTFHWSSFEDVHSLCFSFFHEAQLHSWLLGQSTSEVQHHGFYDDEPNSSFW